MVLITVWLRRARLGHYLLAMRADEDAARAAGINVLKAKLQGMALSAFLTGIGGGLFAMYVRVLDPPSLFTLPDIGVKFALISLIGGIGTIIGPVIGAILIVPLENFLRGWLGGDIPGGHLIILGAILVVGVAVPQARHRRRRPRGACAASRGRRMSDASSRSSRRRAASPGCVAVDCGLVRDEPRRDPQPDRAERRRQDHAVQSDHRPAQAERRARSCSRDETINDLPPHARAQRGMGRTFQIAKPLIGLTTRENVMVGAFLRHAGARCRLCGTPTRCSPKSGSRRAPKCRPAN